MATHTIELDGDGLMRQAKMTAHDYMSVAITDINEMFGKGAAKKHPELVAALMKTAALDFGASIIAQQIRSGLDAIAQAISASREP